MAEDGDIVHRGMAFHEAGHIVAGVALGRWLQFANVKTRKGQFVGLTKFGRHPSLDSRRHKSRARFEFVVKREIVIAWAGFVSETLAHIRHDLDGTELADGEMICLMLWRLSCSRHKQEELGSQLRLCAANILDSRWQVVEKTARRLFRHGHIDGTTVRRWLPATQKRHECCRMLAACQVESR